MLSPSRRSAGFALTLALSATSALAGDGDLDLDFHPADDGVFHFRIGTEGDAETRRVVGASDGAVVMLVRVPTGAHDVWRRVTATGASASCAILPATTSFTASDAIFDRLGRLVVVGTTQDPWQVVVARYLYPACELDTSFDGNGVAGLFAGHDALGPVLTEWRTAPGGFLTFHFLYVAAFSQEGAGRDIVLARLWDDGALDTDWGGGDGLARLDVAPEACRPIAIGVDRHRRIVVAGRYEDWRVDECENGFCEDFLVARFDPDGTRDDSFDGNGLKRVAFDFVPDGRDLLTGLALSPDGRIALIGEVEGSSRTWMGIAVLRENGALESGFDGNGVKLVDLPDYESTFGGGAVFQTDGKLVVAGSARISFLQPYLYDSFAARLLPSGALDASFGDGGVELLPIDLYPGANDRALAVGLAAGRPIVGGYAVRSGLGLDAYLLRLDNGLIFQDGFESGNFTAWF